MPFKSIIKDIRGIQHRAENKLKKSCGGKCVLNRGRSHIAPESLPSPSLLNQQSQWANLPPELLLDIIQQVESNEILWPARRDVVSCAAVCRSWRETTKEVVRTPEECGLLTFPMSLKQPGPRDAPIQCFIKRERATSTYRLYLGLSPALSEDASKLLLAAKKIRKAMRTEFLVSLGSDDFSRASDTYVGKLRSNFLGTKFVIYDSQPSYDSAIEPFGRSCPKACLNKASSRVPIMNYNVATISYDLNVLRTRGPRRMRCVMHLIPISAIQEGGIAPTPATFKDCLNRNFSLLPVLKRISQESGITTIAEPLEPIQNIRDPLVLKNKAPRWHGQLQCWCLNFKGRVTVASVKNFQLVATVDSSNDVAAVEQEKVILQFGKIGKDIFTMDYRYPLSAFQAFAICLSSFDTKPACE